MRFVYLFAGALLSAGVSAQTPGEFSLNEGIVKFTAPPAWPVIMQKTEGNPQAVAFQVKDPADEGTGEATRVTVSTKLLDDTSNFQALVNAESEGDVARRVAMHVEGVRSREYRRIAIGGGIERERTRAPEPERSRHPHHLAPGRLHRHPGREGSRHRHRVNRDLQREIGGPPSVSSTEMGGMTSVSSRMGL